MAAFVSVELTSSTVEQITSAPIHIGGREFSVQFEFPASITVLKAVEVSNDKANWITQAGAIGAESLLAVTVRPRWARASVTTDAFGPRLYKFGFAIFKETE